jgi:hypothetical protein
MSFSNNLNVDLTLGVASSGKSDSTSSLFFHNQQIYFDVLEEIYIALMHVFR